MKHRHLQPRGRLRLRRDRDGDGAHGPRPFDWVTVGRGPRVWANVEEARRRCIDASLHLREQLFQPRLHVRHRRLLARHAELNERGRQHMHVDYRAEEVVLSGDVPRPPAEDWHQHRQLGHAVWCGEPTDAPNRGHQQRGSHGGRVGRHGSRVSNEAAMSAGPRVGGSGSKRELHGCRWIDAAPVAQDEVVDVHAWLRAVEPPGNGPPWSEEMVGRQGGVAAKVVVAMAHQREDHRSAW